MIRSTLFVIVSMTLAVPAPAHHGAGTFDLRSYVTFEGARLTEVELINPHSWLYFDVTDQAGRVEHHRCEMRSAHVLRRSGWTTDLFESGQVVTINASPDSADPNSCYLQTILFKSGNRMDRYGQYVTAPEGGIREVRGPLVEPNTRRELRRPTGEPNITGDWAPVQLVMVDPRGVGGGLVPLDQLDQLQDGRRPGGGGRGPWRRDRAAALRRHRAD